MTLKSQCYNQAQQIVIVNEHECDLFHAKKKSFSRLDCVIVTFSDKIRFGNIKNNARIEKWKQISTLVLVVSLWQMIFRSEKPETQVKRIANKGLYESLVIVHWDEIKYHAHFIHFQWHTYIIMSSWKRAIFVELFLVCVFGVVSRAFLTPFILPLMNNHFGFKVHHYCVTSVRFRNLWPKNYEPEPHKYQIGA